jgi:hypothetical protein
VTDEPPRRTLGARWAWAEDVVVVLVAAVATLVVEWTVIVKPRVFQTDAMIHEFWMRRFQDPALFHDPLTNALRARS